MWEVPEWEGGQLCQVFSFIPTDLTEVIDCLISFEGFHPFCCIAESAVLWPLWSLNRFRTLLKGTLRWPRGRIKPKPSVWGDDLGSQWPARLFLLPRSASALNRMAFWKNYPIDNAPFCGDFRLSYTDWCSVRTSCWILRTDQVLYGSSILMRGRYPSRRAEDPNVNIAPCQIRDVFYLGTHGGTGGAEWYQSTSLHLVYSGASSLWKYPN